MSRDYRAGPRRRWLPVVVTAVMLGLIGNAVVEVGFWPMFILAGAAAGLYAVVAAVMGVTGYSVSHHARREQAAIEAVHGRKELTR